MKVFYHNDNDGKAAAHMVYLYAKATNKEINETDFFEVNYKDNVPNADVVDKGETVYIVDYSFTEATYSQLSAISFKANGNVHWFDHHKSSLEILDYVKNTNICKEVIIDMNRSGAKIAYDVLIAGFIIEEDNNIERVITLVDDYDRWIHKYPESLLFNYGSMLVPNGPTDSIWEMNPDALCEIGKTIKQYKDITDTKTCKSNKYTIKINDKKCIVLNTPMRSSQAFGKYFDEYKFAIVWSFNGKDYSYSVYSTLEDIDCSVIAKHFNPTGGGHKGAAGFTSDKLLFKSGFSFRIRMPKEEVKKD